jgi:alkanesulfonate monooxygenase SsuD/methylene tetrahydromethanopterin reductase-like flavin-dependent oxidoreductase (luciferase family)
MIIDTEFNSAAQIPSDICLRAAVEAEQRGFGCVWKGAANNRDPFVLLSGMAALTERIAFGTAIYHVFGSSPVTLGIQAATFSEMSGGRLLLGIGVGNPVIAGWHGQQFTRPLALAREYIQIIRAVYAGEKIPAIEGEFFSTRGGFKLAFEPPRQPLQVWLAGLGPQMARLAGKISDGVVINMADGDVLGEIIATFRDGARDAGRDPAAVHAVSKIRVSLHEDITQARWALKKVLVFYALQRGYSEVLRRMGWGQVVDTIAATHKTQGFTAARRAVPDEMLEAVPMYAGTDLSGLPAKLAIHQAAGVDRCNVAYVPSDDTRQWQEIRHFLGLAETIIAQASVPAQRPAAQSVH